MCKVCRRCGSSNPILRCNDKPSTHHEFVAAHPVTGLPLPLGKTLREAAEECEGPNYQEIGFSYRDARVGTILRGYLDEDGKLTRAIVVVDHDGLGNPLVEIQDYE